MSNPQTNPYVGPKPFAEEEWELFFGRRHEAATLLSLVLRNRLVLFCAPSGAGKTSLLNTSLRRELGQQGFEILPIARVSGDVPAGAAKAANIFVFNLILTLDHSQQPATTLSQTRLAQYLRQTRPPASGDQPGSPAPYVLIIDQFEEIFTAHPECWDQRGNFFEQLCEAMAHDKLLWVVLAMREEYIARLDRYAPLVPGQLTTRFYMQGLEHDAALEAIEKPAKLGGRPFEPGVAQKLVDKLCLMKVRNREVTSQPGEFIEPVQLQVVCQQLWQAIKAEPHETIRLADVERVAGEKGLDHFIDSALGRFYEEVVGKTVQKTGIPEPDLRHWIEEELITPTATRNLVQRGPDETEGIANPVVDRLEKQLLIHRADVRSEGDWYELIHDCLISPIRSSNLVWYQQQQPLIQMAREWDQSDRSDSLLLEGRRLKETLSSDWQPLGSLVGEFLSASRALQGKKEEKRRIAEQQKEMAHELQLAKAAEERQRVEAKAAQKLAEETEARRRVEAVASQKLRRRAIWLAGAFVFALLAAVAAIITLNRYTAETEKRSAETWAREAEQLITTEMQRRSQPQLSLLLAVEAVSRMPRSDTFLSQYPLEAFYRILENTAGIPLRDQNGQVATEITTLAVSANGQWAAAGTGAGTVHVWKLAEGNPAQARASLAAHRDGVTALAFSPDEQWLASGGQAGLLNVIELATLQMTPVPPGKEKGEVLALAFHPTERWLAVGRDQAPVQRLDLPPSDQPGLNPLLGGDSADTATLAFSPNGAWLATVSTTDTLRLWPLTKASPVNESRLLSEGKNGMIAFSPKSEWLAAGKAGEPAVHLFDVRNQDAVGVKLAGIEQGVRAVRFSQAGEFLVVGDEDGVARWWNMGEVAWDISEQVQAPPPSKPPAPPGSEKSPVSAPAILSRVSPRPVKVHDGAVQALAFAGQSFAGQSERISLLATAGADRAIRLWASNDLTAPQVQLYGHDAEVTAVFFGSSPKFLLSASQDRTVRFWDRDERRAPGGLTELEADLETWIAKACSRAGRDFTVAERALYLADPEAPSACANYLVTPGS